MYLSLLLKHLLKVRIKAMSASSKQFIDNLITLKVLLKIQNLRQSLLNGRLYLKHTLIKKLLLNYSLRVHNNCPKLIRI